MRSPRRTEGSRPVRRWTLAVALVGLCACDSGEPAWEARFADFVGHQTGNVSTDVVSTSRNTASAGWGWRSTATANGSEDHFELVDTTGRLAFRAVAGETVAVEIEAAAGGGTRRSRVRVGLNGRSLGWLKLSGEWRTFKVELPPGSVRSGLNQLTVRGRRGGEAEVDARARARRFRFVADGGRPIRTADRSAIRVRQEGVNGVPSIEMPTASRLSLVAELPAESSFAAELSVDLDSSESVGAVTVAVRLLDADGAEHELWKRSFGEAGAASIAASLAPWEGQVVRVELAVDGTRNARVRWTDAALTSRRAGPVEPRPQPLSAPASGRLGRPDVVVILLDAARADAFSVYGSEAESPHVDALAVAGTLFEQARSPAPWTAPTVSALLAGRYPDSLGVEAWGDRLPAGVSTLPELLLAAGYRTVLYSQHPVYRYRPDLRRGFEEVHFGRKDRREDLPGGSQLAADDRPSFSLVHLLPPHDPYRPPEPFFGRLTGGQAGVPEPLGDFLRDFPNRRDPGSLQPTDLRYIRDRYLENVQFADHLVGRVVEALRARRRFEESLIVVLSDHGEAFLEHGRFFHTDLVYREYLHVPLVVKWPAAVASFEERVAEPVNVIDLVPTLLDGLGIDAGDRVFQGRSLLPRALDGVVSEPWTYAVTLGTSSRHRRPRPRAAVEHDGWRLVYDLATGTKELYRLADDPLEQLDLSSRHPTLALRLEQQLLRQRALNRELLRAAPADATERELDPRLVEELEALGYL